MERKTAPSSGDSNTAGSGSSHARASLNPAPCSRSTVSFRSGEVPALGHVPQVRGVRRAGGDLAGGRVRRGDVPEAPALGHQPPARAQGRVQSREQALVIEDPVEGRGRDDQVDGRIELQRPQVRLAEPHAPTQIGQLTRRPPPPSGPSRPRPARCPAEGARPAAGSPCRCRTPHPARPPPPSAGCAPRPVDPGELRRRDALVGRRIPLVGHAGPPRGARPARPGPPGSARSACGRCPRRSGRRPPGGGCRC